MHRGLILGAFFLEIAVPLFFDEKRTHEENCAAIHAQPANAIQCGSNQLLADLLNLEKQASCRPALAGQATYTTTSNNPVTIVARIPYGSDDALGWGSKGAIHQAHNFHTLAPIQTNSQGVVKALKNFGGFNWRSNDVYRWVFFHSQADLKSSIAGRFAPPFGPLSPTHAVRWVFNLPLSKTFLDSNGFPFVAVHLSFELFAENDQFVATVHGTSDRPHRLRNANSEVAHTGCLASWNGFITEKGIPFFCFSINGDKLANLPVVQRWEFVVDTDLPPQSATGEKQAIEDLFSSLSSSQFRISTFDPHPVSMSDVKPDDVICFWFFLSPPNHSLVHRPNFSHPNLPEALHFDFSPLKMRWDTQFLPNAVLDCVISKHRPCMGALLSNCVANAGGGDCFFIDLG
jgi:hypothetical protein